MSKLRVFVIEDDFIEVSKLKMHLEEMGYEWSGSATNAGDALNKVAAVSPDLVITDIHLEGDRDGIQVVELLNEKAPIPVIFITSYRDKETFDRAKATFPYAYILKPYDKDTLQSAIELTIQRFSNSRDHLAVGTTLPSHSGWKEDRMADDNLFIKSEGKLVKVKVHEILYIEVSDKICRLGVGQEVHQVRIPLQKLEQRLPAHLFLKIHRSFIVNKAEISAVDTIKNEVFIHHHKIPIGRSYKQAFLDGLDQLDY